MTAPLLTRVDPFPIAAEAADNPAEGWYLYGITRRSPPAAALADAGAAEPLGTTRFVPPDDALGDASGDARGDATPLQLLECCGLAAVVRPVLLADYSDDVLRKRLRSASDLETMVRSHNRVIDAFHAQRAILPARFGIVYANSRDILSALRSACDTLLPKLHSLDGCDEWGFHLYADRAIVRERVALRTPAIAQLRDEIAAARPGRAYFLDRQLRNETEGAIRDALATLAQTAFDRLEGSVVSARPGHVTRAAGRADEIEILRAAFLVARDRIDRFDEELSAIADAGEGLRCECSGPWAPYSFAICDVGGAA